MIGKTYRISDNNKQRPIVAMIQQMLATNERQDVTACLRMALKDAEAMRLQSAVDLLGKAEGMVCNE